MTSTTRYLSPGVDITLFQCCLEVERSDVGVETGMSKIRLSSTTVSHNMCISFFWGQISQTIQLYVTLAPWGAFVPVDEKTCGNSLDIIYY